MIRHILTGTLLLALPVAAFAQYEGWEHSAAITILTTPEGADLPATAAVEGFPLLVRLHADWFDFKLARAGGEDVRFSATPGTPLPYEVEAWNPAAGIADI